MRNLFFIIVGAAFLIFSGFLLVEENIENNNDKDTPENPGYKSKLAPPFISTANQHWADSIIKTMTTEEKLGQLFMVAAYSNKGEDHQQELEKLVQEHHIGGMIFFKGTPSAQASMTNSLQNKSNIPLMVGIDGEWGLSMRLDSTIKYPKQMTLGAIQDDNLIYQMGSQIAKECSIMNINVNFAPVADVNNNPKNPVINYRSFGENKHKVTQKCLAYMNGMQDNGILANAKHFPGHGDTDSDSHKTLPIISHDLERLDSLELYPFKHLIDSGLGSMMVAHLYIPSLDSTKNRASTLSTKIVTDLLKYDLNFDGLIFTDALNMRGVSAYYDPGMLEVEAFKAGNDILLFSEDVPKAIQELKNALNKGEISISQVEDRCRKILMTKKWMGLDRQKPIQTKNLIDNLNPVASSYTNQVLFENALTVIKNDNELLPITGLANKRIASVNIGSPAHNTFSNMVDTYCNLDKFSVSSKLNFEEVTAYSDTLSSYDLVIVSIFDMNQRPYKNFGFSNSANDFINAIANQGSSEIILNVMGNPYCLENASCTENVNAILINYEERNLTENLSAQLIFGGIQAKGKLPVSIGKKWAEGHGIETREPIRFKYTTPLELGITEADLKPIETIVNTGIKDGVFPGCQILIAKDGKVFYQRSFGKHTYSKEGKPVENSDIYDLASITKIASSTASMMHMQDQKRINVDSSLNTYIKHMVDSTDYADVKLKEMLTHQAGFKAWIPFYIRTLHKGQPKIELYSIHKTDFFNTQVANDLYIHDGVRDSIFKRILSTEVSSNKKYLYSDLGYYFINEIIRTKTGKTQDQFVDETFYQPLGLGNIGYKPAEKWDINRVPPTEDDKTFRHQVVKGYVHDQGSALLGGVCGHAGLFANSNDLAVMMQMFMNYGTYGGDRFYSEEVGKLFTSSPYYNINRNRRGIGFDKPVRGGGSGPTCSGCASNESFGHSGFTGTLTWADPKTGLVYVFLSNRTFPDSSNRKIISTSTRTRIMQTIYDALDAGEKRLNPKKS